MTNDNTKIKLTSLSLENKKNNESDSLTVDLETCTILPMLQEQNLAIIDPKRFARAGQKLSGEIMLSSLNLPPEVIAGLQGVVYYHIHCGVDKENFVYIQGRIESELVLECQRCLQPLMHPVNSEFFLSPVSSGQEASKLPLRYEAIFMDNEALSVARIVEEELILNLPISPMHVKGCSAAVVH